MSQPPAPLPSHDSRSGNAWVRGRMPGPVVVLIGLAALVITLGGMRAASSVLGPILLAIVIAIAVAPLQAWLTRHLPVWLAIVITMIVTYVGVFVFAGAVLWSLYAFGQNIVSGDYQDRYDQLLRQGTEVLTGFGVEQAQILDLLGQVDLNRFASVALGAARSLYSIVSILALALLLLFFIQLDGDGFAKRFAAVRRIRPGVAASLTDFATGTRRYLLVTGAFGLVVAALDVVLLIILDVPLPFVWGVLAFVAGFIPTVGLILSIIPPAAIALLANGYVDALIVVIGFLIINNVLQTVIQPRFIGDAVGVSISVAFLSLVVWGYVLGGLGAFLAIPLTLLTVAMLSDSNPRHRWLNILAGDKAPPEEELQRLEALADAEAEPDPVQVGTAELGKA